VCMKRCGAYVHVEYLDCAYRVLAIYAIPANYREHFHYIDGYYSFDVSTILQCGGFVVMRGK
jgi:hypothetical protein